MQDGVCPFGDTPPDGHGSERRAEIYWPLPTGHSIVKRPLSVASVHGADHTLGRGIDVHDDGAAGPEGVEEFWSDLISVRSWETNRSMSLSTAE